MSSNFSLSPLAQSSGIYYASCEQWIPSNSMNEKDSSNLLSLGSPQLLSEIVFEKTNDFSCYEEDFIPFEEAVYFQDFIEKANSSGDVCLKKLDPYQIYHEGGDAVIDEEPSECSRHETDEEELASISTRGSLFAGFTNVESDCMSVLDDNFLGSNDVDIEAKIKAKAYDFMRHALDEEKEYIEQALPNLICSFQEVYSKYRITLTDAIFETALIRVLEERRALIETESQFIKTMIEHELEETQMERPSNAIGEDDLNFANRKIKKILKGNKNNSSLNHLNENYVSNIFQFAKKNFPEDQELQKLANTRNVSASNFRRLMNHGLTDKVLLRRAKARIRESGKELIGNIEYWMNEGYFDQCNEREKYIAHKQKALRDLALGEKH